MFKGFQRRIFGGPHFCTPLVLQPWKIPLVLRELSFRTPSENFQIGKRKCAKDFLEVTLDLLFFWYAVSNAFFVFPVQTSLICVEMTRTPFLFGQLLVVRACFTNLSEDFFAKSTSHLLRRIFLEDGRKK